MAKEILCAFGVDVDAVAGWLGSYGGEDSPDDISRGLFAGEVGTPRLVNLFKRLGVKTTWFIPGTHRDLPKQTAMVWWRRGTRRHPRSPTKTRSR
jgi:peptidoglycan/xylan/chitin deacetylase (PgdA/CDA1 family)